MRIDTLYFTVVNNIRGVLTVLLGKIEKVRFNRAGIHHLENSADT